MGVSSALYTGVSGLNANGNAMSVIGNNIANSNTVGFKSSRAIFSDLLSASVSSSGGSSQVGRGTQLANVSGIFSQGTFENTESNYDLAVEGEGFFVVSPPGNEEQYYTRAGAFNFDGDGYMVSPEGYRVQGKAYLDDGTLAPGDPTDIRVRIDQAIPAQATSTIGLTTNLNASEGVKPLAGFDATDPSTYNYSVSSRIFDSLGNTHLVTSYFLKNATNEWGYTVQDDAGNTLASAANAITFDGGGNLTGGGSLDITGVDWGNGASAQDFTLNFNTTQYNSQSQVISQDQDGYGPGSLTKISIDGDGNVVTNYSNGEQIKQFRIVLSKFPNPQGLSREGSNLFSATDTAGPARTGLSGGELGTIFTNSLEQSNVDLGNQFVKMITTQRGFQANSKIITTTDELLNELINLKR